MTRVSDIDVVLVKGQCRVERHSEQFDVITANCTSAPTTQTPCDLLTCDSRWLVPKITAAVLVGFRRRAFSTNHRDTSLAQLSRVTKSPRSAGFSETYNCISSLRIGGIERCGERLSACLKMA